VITTTKEGVKAKEVGGFRGSPKKGGRRGGVGVEVWGAHWIVGGGGEKGGFYTLQRREGSIVIKTGKKKE